MRSRFPMFALCGAMILSACEAPVEYHLAGEPIDDAKVRMEVDDRDSIDASSGSPKAFRRIHLEWEITPGAFGRFPHLLAVENDWLKDAVRLDTLHDPSGRTDFLWECQKAWYADTVDCDLAESHRVEVFAVLPQGLLLRVAWARLVR